MRLGWIVVMWTLLVPHLGWASSAGDKLVKAKGAYEDGDYAKSSKVLEDMFRSADLTGDELRQAHIYLAASYYYLGNEAKARLEFDALFRQSPLARVDPVLFPPEIVEIANDEAKKLEAEQDRAPPRTATIAPVPANPPPNNGVVVTTVPQARLENRTSIPSTTTGDLTGEPKQTPPPIGYSFIPFGVGQFANDQYGKGALFLSAEVIALASFTTASALAESLKSGGTPFISYTLTNPAQDQGKFNTYQTIYLVSFWTGVGIYVIGVVDSLLSRPSQADLDAHHSVASLDLGLGRTVQLAPTGAVLRF